MLGTAFSKQIFLVTIHPETSSSTTPEKLVNSVLEALDSFPEASIVFTSPNPDPGHEQISKAIQEFVKTRDNCVLVDSLGHRAYLSLMLQSTIVIGNSSSGVLEAPIAGIPAIDVGDRQKGRVSHKGVRQCPADSASIRVAISDFLELSREGTAFPTEPLDENTVSQRILRLIINQLNSSGLANKAFNDL
jgi:UDP-N-acetylglucosamine 2-epimerase